MKYFLNGTWCNDSTIEVLPAGATELSDAKWDNRQARPEGWLPEPPTYQQLRAAEYAKRNQFEMQFDDATTGSSTWVDWQREIKLAIPKT